MAYLLDLYVLATSLVTIASVVCNYTDTPQDDAWVAKAYKVLEQFAFLGNKAKNQTHGRNKDKGMIEETKEMIDVAAASTAIMTLTAWLPPVASLFTVIWLGLRIYESDTIQKLIFGKTLTSNKK